MAFEVSIKTALSNERITYSVSDQEAAQPVCLWLDQVLKHNCSGGLRDPMLLYSIKSRCHQLT
jgi:hypothetical protein